MEVLPPSSPRSAAVSRLEVPRSPCISRSKSLPHNAALTCFGVSAFSGWRIASAAVPDPVPSEEPATASSTVVVTDKPDSPADEKVTEESSPADEKVAEESSASSASVEATVVAPASSGASEEDGGLDDLLSKVSPCCFLLLYSTSWPISSPL